MNLPFFNRQAIAAALPFPALMDHIAASDKTVKAPLRMSMKGLGAGETLVMPVASTTLIGVKILTIVPDNRTVALPVIAGIFALFDAANGVALATMDAGELTARRTAAVSALASRRLSRAASSSLLVVGTGHLAPYLAEAHCVARPIERILVWGRRPAEALRCVEEIRARLPAIIVEPVTDLEAAVRCSDIVSAATRATRPLLRGAWVAPGTHLDLVGGYRPDMREIDDAGVVAARIFVDTMEGALREAGDLCSPMQRGILSEADVLGDLAGLLAGAGRLTDDEITLFKSVGSAVSDLAAAELVWQRHHA